MKNTDLRKFCVAPMMGYTTPHARKLYRILSKRAFLFTEMIPSNTMLYSKNKNLLISILITMGFYSTIGILIAFSASNIAIEV